ncbi:50S ribosomal protein L23 [bacterium]|jgi:large subunit ribosomal protein L23|nr:50S ribosomal protein L23 [bacterium]MBT3853366.1 50S ribosomal protein L23 [bacterium]MBT4633495.1 50S ribosomal protein L23 [bacterium]MBT5491076.1 50S ribosomal protein L23 [bacterium]MBT6779153.1 50S ribosomal protein L23 [bacterium]
MRIFRILKKPITTEKTSVLEMTTNTYVFEVDSSATKIDIKKSVTELYKVEVASVNVLHTREKFKYGKKK